MSFFILAFLTSLVTTLLVVRSASSHAWMTADTDFSGPQKFHSRAVPRIGGVGVLVAMAVAGVFDNLTQKDARLPSGCSSHAACPPSSSASPKT